MTAKKYILRQSATFLLGDTESDSDDEVNIMKKCVIFVDIRGVHVVVDHIY
jgi:hypothetical protein